MLFDNYTNVKDNLNSYCDKVINENEVLIITRKEGKNVAIISLGEYNNLKEIEYKYRYLMILDQSKKDMEYIKRYEEAKVFND